VVRWGIEEAKKEGVPLSVISAYANDDYYNHLGFVIPSGKASDGEGNPLAGRLKGGYFWWYESHLAKS
jgi:hypothetical protein